MNNITILGRLTKDVDVKTGQSGKSYINNSIAVDRRFKDNNGNKITDFFDIKAFGKTAEAFCYANKGDRIGITGELQTESWEKDGEKRTKVVIMVNSIDLIEPKTQKQAALEPKPEIVPDRKVQASLDMFGSMAQASENIDTGSLPFEL